MVVEKAYCINLDERPDKWEQTKAAFVGSGITLQRFPGIRKQIGWHGCGAAHVAVAHEALRLGLPYVIVVEDDCLLSSDFAKRWPVVLDALKADTDWDIFLGGPTYVQGPIDVNTPLLKIEQGYALHFYVLKACAYEKAIAWNPDRHDRIDVYYSNQFRIATTHPALAIQRPSRSDIRNEDMNYTKFFHETEETLEKLLYSVQTRHATIAFLALSALLVFALSR